jgi:hypothetical protein
VKDERLYLIQMLERAERIFEYTETGHAEFPPATGPLPRSPVAEARNHRLSLATPQGVFGKSVTTPSVRA